MRKNVPQWACPLGDKLAADKGVRYNSENEREVWSMHICEEKCNNTLLEKLIAMSAD